MAGVLRMKSMGFEAPLPRIPAGFSTYCAWADPLSSLDLSHLTCKLVVVRIQ